jgi:hypothetical protein
MDEREYQHVQFDCPILILTSRKCGEIINIIIHDISRIWYLLMTDHHLIWFYLPATYYIYNPEEFGLNLRWDTTYCEFLVAFPVAPGKLQDSNYIRPWPSPSISLQPSLIICVFDVIWFRHRQPRWISVYPFMVLQPFVGPWPLFQFLDPIHGR